MPVFDCCTVSCCDDYSKRGSRGPFRPSRFPYSILPRMETSGKIRLVPLRGRRYPLHGSTSWVNMSAPWAELPCLFSATPSSRWLQQYASEPCSSTFLLVLFSNAWVVPGHVRDASQSRLSMFWWRGWLLAHSYSSSDAPIISPSPTGLPVGGNGKTREYPNYGCREIVTLP